jgi:DNA-binding LytR/AlgR family response regulator
MPAADSMTRTVRAVLADDERLLREQLQLRLSESWPALEIVGVGT